MTIKRRTFIKNSVGILAFPFISKTAANAAVQPSDRITVGCIGVGGMGTGNLRNFLNHEEMKVLAVCDVDKNHRDRAAKLVNDKYGNEDCDSYLKFEDVLARKDIDAVMLALPDHWHGIIAVAAA